MVGTTPETLDAYSIWLKARSVVSAAQYPSRIDYTIAVSSPPDPLVEPAM